MKRTTISVYLVALLSLLTLLTSCTSRDPHGNTAQSAQQAQEEQVTYTCPMHPSVISDRPGACPVCGMALVRVMPKHNQEEMVPQKPGTVTLPATQRVLANVATTVVKTERLNKEISAAAKVEFAEPNVRHISTRFAGRIEKLYVSYTGQRVQAGEPVADVYSPEAISAQREYLLALEASDHAQSGNGESTESARRMVADSRQKLLLLSFTDRQVAELERTKEVSTVVTVYSPISGTVVKKNADPQQYVSAGETMFDVTDLSSVWVFLDLYESDIRLVRPGSRVEATFDAYPNERFVGSVTFVSPTVDPLTRTLRVRANFGNPEGKLKPEMFGYGTIILSLPPSIVVPASAVIATGKRTAVWIEQQPGVYEPREVTLGQRAGDRYQVLSGLSEGETIVVSGGYLIDSESQLQLTTTNNHDHSHE